MDTIPPQAPEMNTTIPGKPIAPKPNFAIPILSVLILLLIGCSIFLVYQNMRLSKELTALKIIPSPIPTPTPAPVAGTYMNQKLGFSFTYPKDLTHLYDYLSEYTDKGNLSGDLLLQNYLDKGESQITSEDFQAGIWVSKDDGSTLETVAKNSGSKSTTSLKVDGVDAVRGTAGQKYVDVPTVWVKHNGTLFMIQLSTTNSTNKKWFDQILSTFKFLDQTSGSLNMKTYANQQLGITVKYPSFYSPVEKFTSLKSGQSIFIVTGLFNFSPQSLSLCKTYQESLCLIPGKNWAQAQDILPTTVSSKKALSFFVSTKNIDGANDVVHVIQTTEKPLIEIALEVSGEGGEETFQQILSTFKFTQ